MERPIPDIRQEFSLEIQRNAHLKERVKQLKAENERLRKVIEEMHKEAIKGSE